MAMAAQVSTALLCNLVGRRAGQANVVHCIRLPVKVLQPGAGAAAAAGLALRRFRHPARVSEHLKGAISFYECLQQDDGTGRATTEGG
jgi:hypothetical protein